MKFDWRLPKAILRRELTSYFSNPTGYVFITLFVFLSAIAAFWQEEFFQNNLANLDQLNAFFPYLLVFFIPAITMSLWAEEQRNGTDELLLTLPATDAQIVVGKYLAGLAIYTIALLFSLSNVIVLLFLGNPDFGLLFSTYVGYWLMGAALLALGMIASQLTANLTVAFIVGALLCGVPVFIAHGSALFSGGFARLIEGLSFADQFRDFASGVISFSGLLYFVTFAAAMLYLNVALLGRRHWQTGDTAPKLGRHHAVRGVAMVVAVAALTILAARLGGRLDSTAERIHSLAPSTRDLIRSLDPNKPVFIEAFLSPVVPRSYLETKNNIVSLLREFDATGGERIHARIVDAEKYSDAANEAQDRFNIRPRPVPVFDQVSGGPDEVILGVAFTSGADEFVIPFFDPGLPVEYELMRSVRVVANAGRKKVGILETEAGMFGGFDFQARRQSQDWSIVAELRKQYDVEKVAVAGPIPEDLDVLVAVLPTTLSQENFDKVTEYVKSGKPALVAVDPLPAFNIELSPQQLPPSPFERGQPPKIPASHVGLMDALGLDWSISNVAWSKNNPHPQFRGLQEEIIFVTANDPTTQAFNPEQPIAAGLQEVVLLYPGVLTAKEDAEGLTVAPLLESGTDSGTLGWMQLVQRSIFGVQLNQNLRHEPDEESYMLAARVEGEGEGGVNAVVIADADMMGEQFFELRRRGVENLNFDNVTFLLNAVDALAGDEDFIELRKRRPRHRTLTAVENQTRDYEEQRLEETQAAEERADKELEDAQKRLDERVAALRERTDLDAQTKQIMIRNLESVENRRLAVARKNIEDNKQRTIERSRADMEGAIRNVQSGFKLAAVVLPPIPAFALFLFVSARRLRREQASVSRDRLVDES